MLTTPIIGRYSEMPKKAAHGGARKGSGRKLGVMMPHLRDPNSRVNRVHVSVSDREWDKLAALADRSGVPMATCLYNHAKRGGL
jgi:hypothetical protein